MGQQSAHFNDPTSAATATRTIRCSRRNRRRPSLRRLKNRMGGARNLSGVFSSLEGTPDVCYDDGDVWPPGVPVPTTTGTRFGGTDCRKPFPCDATTKRVKGGGGSPVARSN